MFTYKQVIVARKDLDMSSGKLAVQVAHGSVNAAEKAMNERRKWFEKWTEENRKKVVVKIPSEEDLYNLRDKADSLKVPFEIIQDAGLTELSPGTPTVLAIGPAPSELVDEITGDLPLW